MVNVTALEQANDGCKPADEVCGTIDDDAVDQTRIATFPQAATEQPRPTGKERLVEPVKVVLVVKQGV